MKRGASVGLVVWLGCALALTPAPAAADILFLDAVQRGWIKQGGGSNGTDSGNSYAVGNCAASMSATCLDGEVRNFFVFNVPTYSGQIVSGGLVVDTGTVVPPTQSALMTYAFTSLPATFDFSSLGTGTPYGGRNFSGSNGGTTFEIPLTAAAIAAIQPSAPFGIGGRITLPAPQGPGGKPAFVFGGSPGRTRLHLISLAAIVDVVEYYNATLDHYFISSLPPDIEALDSGRFPGWQRTGEKFRALSEPSTVTSPVCRFYIPPPYGDSHFYSASPAECDLVKASFPMFVFESPSVMNVEVPDPDRGFCAAGRIPVYRLWNARADTNHRYTTSVAIRDAMVARGYVPEGYGPDAVAMCSY